MFVSFILVALLLALILIENQLPILKALKALDA
jgi:hypothetical protein